MTIEVTARCFHCPSVFRARINLEVSPIIIEYHVITTGLASQQTTTIAGIQTGETYMRKGLNLLAQSTEEFPLRSISHELLLMASIHSVVYVLGS